MAFLDGVLPTSALPFAPMGSTTTRDGLKAMTRQAFRAEAGESDSMRQEALLNEALAAVKTIGGLRRLQQSGCVSTAVTKGIRVTATSEVVIPPGSSRERGRLQEEAASGMEDLQRTFMYRIRIDNIGDRVATLLERDLRIYDQHGALHHNVHRGEGVVGHQPVLQPGHTIVYVSSTGLMKTRRGHMEGSFRLAWGETSQDEVSDEDMFSAELAPFLLVDDGRVAFSNFT
ncbi:unnamed protein product [Choristocarpus tenellus]